MFSTLSDQVKGTVICLIGILVVTPNALMIRKVEHMPMMAVQFYSNLIFAVTMTIILIFQEGLYFYRKFLEIGWIGWLAGLVFGAYLFLIILAFQITAAATALVILASNPMFSALFSYLFLKETIPMRTMLASLVCFGSILLIFASEIGDSSGGIEGIVYSLLAAMLLSTYLVMLQVPAMYGGKEPDMQPCIIIAALFCTLIPACTAPDLTTAHGLDWLYLFINGSIVLTVSVWCLTIGPKYITAPEVSLYSLIETVLGPVWVWLGGYERPPIMSVYGGAALISALTIHSIVGIREENKKKSLVYVAGNGNSGDIEAVVDTAQTKEVQFNEAETADDVVEFDAESVCE